MKRLVIATIFLTLALVVRGPLFTRAGEAGMAEKLAGARITTTFATTGPSSDTAIHFKTLSGHLGYWRVGEDDNGAWWFVAPDDTIQFLNTVTTVQPFQRGRDSTGPAYMSVDWKPGSNAQAALDPWARATMSRIMDMGFKGLGAWCHPIFHQYNIPMTRDLNIWDWIGASDKRLYSLGWASEAELAIKSQCQTLRDNKSLVGYYTDNELDWGDGSSGPSIYFDGLPQNDPNRAEVSQVIQATWKTVDQFNKDWDVKIADWKDLDTWDRLPKDKTPRAYNRLFTAWLSHMAGDYFKITTKLVHKYDPNHLVMGVRFRGYAPPEVVRAAKGFTDVQSLNYYVGDARLDLDQFRMMYETANQPVVISEYSFHSLDGRSGNRNLVGFPAQVPDQQARADGYRTMTTNLARVPYVIGADWFQWMDEPPSGRSSDGEDVNFGMVDIDDRPYQALAAAVKSTSPQLNPMHHVSPFDDQENVWRESFASKPVAHVPFLTTPLTINGELSDWPPQAKLQGVRHSQTIGLERSPLPLPNVYLAWNNDGLFMGMEVFDNDIEGAPAKGWWWTKDNVEIWLSTRPIPADQNTYDVNCHQFFFVPNDETASNGVGGVVGQWHREGDALTDNLIPHPEIHQATRVLPDRYVVEMFIPGKALHGWDPRNQPNLSFNIHVRNFQHAIDYFWSAPKELITQLRPNTWGALALEPAIPSVAVH